MHDNKYLNEEKYKKIEKKLLVLSLIILLLGLSIGGFLIYKGTVKPSQSEINKLKNELEQKRQALVDKGVTYNGFTEYTDGEAYDLKVITDALDPSFNHCEFDECQNHKITADYCKLKNQMSEYVGIRSKMIGIFICISSCMISLSIFLTAKRRMLLAFQVQQSMPVVKEGIDEIAPSLGKVAKEVSKGMEEGKNDK